MPREARVLVPNCLYHIVLRGHNRKVVFITEKRGRNNEKRGRNYLISKELKYAKESESAGAELPAPYRTERSQSESSFYYR